MFRAYQAKNQWNLKHIVANLLKLMVPEPLVAVDAETWVEVVLMRQGRRTLVHLVNLHGDRPTDGNYRCTEQVTPVRDLTVRLRRSSIPSRVTLEPGGEAAEWGYGDGVVAVKVPEVHIHRVVAFE